MSVLRTSAIVLRRTNYGEADRIVQLLTPKGKYGVVARGVRREKSKLAGGIELFAVCDVVIQEGKGDLGIITSARLVRFYRHILDNYDGMQFAYEVLKQVGRASEMVDEPEWYDLTVEILTALDDMPTASLALIETWFYVRYAALLGHELSLANDTEGNHLQVDKRYSYDAYEKGLRQASRGELTADHIKLLRLISVKSLAALMQIGGTDAILDECLQVSREHAGM